MHKYKKGQKVMIHPRLAKDFNQAEIPTINSDMRAMAGKVFEIQSRHGDSCYHIMGWTWLEKWLMPVTMDKDEAFEQLVKGQITESEFKEHTRTTDSEV